MRKLCLLLILSMVPMLALAQSDSLTSPTDQNEVQVLVTNGCVTLTPNSHDFGSEPADFSSAAAQFLPLNGCTVNLHLTHVTAQGAAFTQTNHIGNSQVPCNMGAPLPPNEYCEIEVVFTPPSAGSFGNNLVIMYTNDGNPQVLQISAGLSGTGIHDLTFDRTSCSFLSLNGAESYCTVTLQNQEPVRIPLDRCQVSPVPPFLQDTACPMSLAKKGNTGDSVNILLDFESEQPGIFTGQFAVITDSPEEQQTDDPYTVPLVGVARQICPTPCCNGSGAGEHLPAKLNSGRFPGGAGDLSNPWSRKVRPQGPPSSTLATSVSRSCP